MKYIEGTQNGFTLVELSIVLVVLGLLLGGLLSPLSTRIESERRTQNAGMLDEALEALLGFAVVNGRLPCPDTSPTADGVEDNCSLSSSVVTAGRLPYATLGIDAKNDPWGDGHPVLYNVNGAFTSSSPPLTLATQGTGPGILNIYDAAGCTAPANPLALNVPALIWTEAKNFHIGNADEDENSDTDTCFVSQSYTGVSGSEFDDQMVWVSTSIFFNRLVTAGVLP